MAKFFERDGVVLRPLEPEDVTLLYMWESEDDAWRSGGMSAPYSRQLLREYLENYDADIYKTREVRLMINVGADAVGTIDVFNFDPVNSRAEIGVYIDVSHRNSCVASAAIAVAVEDYVFGVLGLHQAYATVRRENDVAQKAFRNCGFAEVAVMKSWLRSGCGKFSDAVILQRFSAEI